MFGRVDSELRSRSLLYEQLATSLDAGVALATALRLAGGGSRDGRGDAAAAAIARGRPLIDALDDAFRLPPTHRLALAAAERAGQLPACLRRLASDVDLERQQRRRLWQMTAYPLLLLHVVVPAASSSLALTAPTTFVTRSLLAVAAIWTAFFAGVAIHRAGQRSGAYVRALDSVPLIGSVLRTGAFLRFFRALAELYGSGVRIQEALDASRAAVGAIAPVDDFSHAAAAARAGATMPAAFATLHSLDPSLRSLLETGATSGDLENALRRVIAELDERWRRLSSRLVTLVASGLYALAVAVVVWSVFRFYAGYAARYDEFDRILHGR